MKKILTIFAILLSPVLILAQNAATERKTPATREEMQNLQWHLFNRNQIRANIDGAIITGFDMQNRVIPLLSAVRQQVANEQDFLKNLSVLENDVLENTTIQKLMVSEFRKRGGKVPNNYISAQINDMIQRDFNNDRSEYLRYLRRMGRTALDEWHDVEENIIFQWMSSELFKYNREISPEKVMKFYDENKKLFAIEESLRYRQITITPMAAETEADAQETAARIHSEAKNGTDFGELAKRYSRDDFRNIGGLSDWKPISGMNERIVEILRKLPDDGITEPMDVSLPGGRKIFVILQRVGHRESGTKPIDEVRALIEDTLLRTESAIARDEAVARLKKKYFVRHYNP